MVQEDYEDEEEEGGLDTTESVLIAPPRFNDDDETEVSLITNHNDRQFLKRNFTMGSNSKQHAQA